MHIYIARGIGIIGMYRQIFPDTRYPDIGTAGYRISGRIPDTGLATFYVPKFVP